MLVSWNWQNKKVCFFNLVFYEDIHAVQQIRVQILFFFTFLCIYALLVKIAELFGHIINPRVCSQSSQHGRSSDRACTKH